MKLRPVLPAAGIAALLATSLASTASSAAPRPLSYLAPGAESYVSDLSFGSYGNLPDEFYGAEGVAIDNTGNVWVADRYNHRITRFTASGDYVISIGSQGSADGELNEPRGIAIDTQRGAIWVADSLNNRLQRFSLGGAFLCKTAALSTPIAVAVNQASGDVYVVESGGTAVRRFGAGCGTKTGFGAAGSGNGQLSSPTGIAVDGNGNIWVADAGNNRVQKFDPAGSFLMKFGAPGSGDSRFTVAPEFGSTLAIAVDDVNDIYVADADARRIQKFRNNGNFVNDFGWYGYGAGQFYYPSGLAIDSRGRVWVSDESANRVQRFVPSASATTLLFKGKWGASGSGDGEFSYPYGVDVNTATGDVYVSDYYNYRIQVFSAAGAFKFKFGSYGTGDGQFIYPADVAVDRSSGAIYVVDTNNNRVQKFDATGAYLAQWGGFGDDNGEFNAPLGIAVDPTTHDVYVADYGNHRVQRFTSAGAFVMGIGNGGKWTGAAPAPVSGNGNAQFNQPSDVTVNPSGQLFVADTGNARIQRFSNAGVFQLRWGASGSAKGMFYTPTGIDSDANGNVYVTELYNYRVQKFRSDGRLIDSWSSYGSENGQLIYPTGIAAGAGVAPFIYVANRGNQRIERYETFGYTAAVTPASRTITAGASTTFTLTLTGVGPNTTDQPVVLRVLSGLPAHTTASFSPSSLVPSAAGTVSTTLTLDTAGTTPARTYTLALEAIGGGQTRVKTVTLTVNP